MKTARSLLWFCVAGVVGLVVDVAVLMLVRDALGPFVGRLVSFLAAATATWLLNRNLAFGGRPADMGLWAEYLRYLGLMGTGGLVNYATYSALAWWLGQAPLQLALFVAAGSLAGLVFNYVGASQWLYRRRSSK